MFSSDKADNLVRVFLKHRAKIEAQLNDRISDTEYATRYLNVSAVSYNQWFNKTRLPSLENVVFSLYPVLGEEVLDALEIKNKTLKTFMRFFDKWSKLDEESQNRIDRLIDEDVHKNQEDGQRKGMEPSN